MLPRVNLVQYLSQESQPVCWSNQPFRLKSSSLKLANNDQECSSKQQGQWIASHSAWTFLQNHHQSYVTFCQTKGCSLWWHCPADFHNPPKVSTLTRSLASSPSRRCFLDCLNSSARWTSSATSWWTDSCSGCWTSSCSSWWTSGGSRTSPSRPGSRWTSALDEKDEDVWSRCWGCLWSGWRASPAMWSLSLVLACWIVGINIGRLRWRIFANIFFVNEPVLPSHGGRDNNEDESDNNRTSQAQHQHPPDNG